MNELLSELKNSVISQLDVAGEASELAPYGNGHINSTWLLTMQEGENLQRYILQKINTHVFQRPDRLMENICSVCDYLRKIVLKEHGNPDLECMTPILFRDGSALYRDDAGEYWRCYRFIENSCSYDLAETPKMMEGAGEAFGLLQKRLDRFAAEQLWETIPKFHNTPNRYELFLRAVEEDVCGRAGSVREEISFWTSRREDFFPVYRMLQEAQIPLRVTHNDTKFNNVLFDRTTGRPLCVVDLDTVMPGVALYDFGDSLRSGASTAAEDETDLSKVSFNLEMFEAFTRGFLSQTRGILEESEKEWLAFSAKLMTMECGIRFLTDYLQGDTYFRIHRPNHNLDRCRTQMRLTADMEAKMERMKEIVAWYC